MAASVTLLQTSQVVFWKLSVIPTHSMLLPIHRWLTYNYELAVPVSGLVERSEMPFFSTVPLGPYPLVLNKRHKCFN